MINIQDAFRSLNDDFGGFDYVTDKLSNRPDLCAMLLLDKLLPGNCDIIGNAEHDIIYFDIDIDLLGKVATVLDIQTLSRCGVMCDSDGLSMFV
jgi:hypothetical protein